MAYAAHLHARYEQRCCLAADDFEVGRFVEPVEAGVVDLVELAEREQPSQPGPVNPLCADPRSTWRAQGRRHEEVAYEYGNVVVPYAVDCWLVAAQLRLVDHVVVDERGIVEHLHRSGCRYHLWGDRPEQACAQQHHDRADLLALGAQVFLYYAVHHPVG